ncbi:MAG: aminopeptidase P family protein [Bacteroidota bacterium]
MFNPEVYAERRKRLKELVGSGLILLAGNTDSPMNYPGNQYHFRQDSTFLYFFGLDEAGLAGAIDCDTGHEMLYGNDIDIEDVIWMGPQPTLKEKGVKVGISCTFPLKELETAVERTKKESRPIHIIPPYRSDNRLFLSGVLSVSHTELKTFVSEKLIKAIVALRSIKDQYEIAEIDKACDIGYLMHTMAMKLCKPGRIERELSGAMEGIALSLGAGVSFPVILSMNGETLHNHYHGNILETGRLMVQDAGAETDLHYASDFTRTIPVGGKFSQKQKEIYQLVLDANNISTQMIKPGIPYRDCHFKAAEVIAEGLKALGLMKGDVKDAVQKGAHCLFFPHGLGHMMGLDVHDMEDLGENYVGYNDKIKRSELFGTAYLRLARELQEGFVLTVEPGIYFIPALIDMWQKENKFAEFINYDKVNEYRSFGGIRIEDDILVTKDGYRLMGKQRVPATVEEIENIMK